MSTRRRAIFGHTFGHSDDSSVGSDHEHAEVGGVTGHAKYGGLEVFFVPGQVDEGDDLGGGSTDVDPI